MQKECICWGTNSNTAKLIHVLQMQEIFSHLYRNADIDNGEGGKEQVKKPYQLQTCSSLIDEILWSLVDP